MEDVNKRRRISFSLSTLSAVLKKSTPGKFAYTCHFQQIGINTTKIEKTGTRFKTDVFAAVKVVDAKAPYLLGEAPPRGPMTPFYHIFFKRTGIPFV